MSGAKDDSAGRGGNFTIIRGPEMPERSRPEIEGMLKEMKRRGRERATQMGPPEAS